MTEEVCETAIIYQNELERNENKQKNGYFLWFLELMALEQMDLKFTEKRLFLLFDAKIRSIAITEY